MLDVATAFPDPGSYALRVDHSTELVRIHQHDSAAGTVLISFPNRHGASGNMTVPLRSLQDGTPLDAEEVIELRALEDSMRAHKRRRRTPSRDQDKARHDELRLRRIYAPILADQMRRAGVDRQVA